MSHFPAALSPKETDVKQLLACNVHLGEQNVTSQMERYCWKRRTDGIHVINIAKTWEKLILAARIFVTIETPSDIAVISAPQIGHRAVLKFAHYTGATALSGRFTPGTFTNQIQEKFFEPRLLIVTDPRVDHQAITESSYVNLPTIAFCSTDARPKHVDVVIPCNNKTTESIGLMYWMLAREILYLRNVIERSRPWDVMVDIFFFRPPEEIEEKKALEEQGYEEQFRVDPGHAQAVHEPPYGGGGGATGAGASAGGGGAGWEAPSSEPWSMQNIAPEGGAPPVSASGGTWAESTPAPHSSSGWDAPVTSSPWDQTL